MKPLQVYLPEPFIKALKQRALDEDCTVADLIRKTLGADVDVYQTKKIPQVVNVLPGRMPKTLEEANDPNSPGYSAKVRPVVIPKKDVYKLSKQTIPKPTSMVDDLLEASSVMHKTLVNGVCKIHGTPLTDRGKCLQKGCKYA